MDYTQPLNSSGGIKTSAAYSKAQEQWVSTMAGLGDAGAVITTTPLGASASYTQTEIDRLAPNGTDSPAFPVGKVRGIAWANQSGTLYLEESDGSSNYTLVQSVAVAAGKTTILPWTAIAKRWYRFRYVNGTTAQSSFALVQQAMGLEDIMEIYGKTISDRPAANAVSIGATFTIVSTEETWMSDGIGWEEK